MTKFSLLRSLGAQATATGRRLGRRAWEEMFNDQQRGEALDLAARGVQGGRRLLDEQFARLFAALGLATQADLDRVHRKISLLRRQLEGLVDALQESAPPPAPPAPPSAPPR